MVWSPIAPGLQMGTFRLAARRLVHRILTGMSIHWTMLHHAIHAENEAQIDDVWETGVRDRGTRSLLFGTGQSGTAGGRGGRAQAFPVESHRSEGCRLSARHDPRRQGRFLSVAVDHRGQL